MSNQNANRDLYIPRNPCLQGILNLLHDVESFDILFDVDGKEKFHAHKLILKGCAPSLAEYCDSCADLTSEQPVLVVPVKNIEPDVFRHLLHYVYGGTIPRDFLEQNSKYLIDAADRFGLGHLKVLAETWYIKSIAITMDNFAAMFYFADTKKCALLKERVMDFLIDNDTDVLKKLTEQEVPQSQTMMTDILTAVARGKRKREQYEGNDPEKIGLMSVNSMRKMLDQRGLGVDGTREMLIEALEKSVDINEVIVEGAGIPEVNGVYERLRSQDGDTFYQKPTFHYRGVDSNAVLHHNQNENHNQWYISILPADRQVIVCLASGSSPHFPIDRQVGNVNPEDMLLYKVKGNSDVTIPATGRSKVIKVGAGPAPTIRFKANVLGD
eukprot:CAMPEP_0172538678 /NCGR_PEP_ID=MMETSP1067-20121228/10024_1 /TAXON_ID=265564 ORGANISM="Thalassiosira punctigera, Strain Tpunct2005C2" /NCGR_SAMPLE_ID=MMETSP1067 /ASSEMBLY_ACC=CAM_ASM_000444 /LENGTH=382 /DNA_ID=CAMNT_0013324225 /DNA_START=265 /DNA_END=1413 /DNA_ORIENTATION=+